MDAKKAQYAIFYFYRSFPGPADVTPAKVDALAQRYYDPTTGLYNYLQFHNDLSTIGAEETETTITLTQVPSIQVCILNMYIWPLRLSFRGDLPLPSPPPPPPPPQKKHSLTPFRNPDILLLTPHFLVGGFCLLIVCWLTIIVHVRVHTSITVLKYLSFTCRNHRSLI